jgi:hypothetical protein
MKFFGCDHNARTTGKIGAGSLRISPAIRCTAAAMLTPNALAAARPILGKPRASRARQKRTKPNRASHTAIQAYRRPASISRNCSGVGFFHSAG